MTGALTTANRTIAVLKKNARGEEVRVDLTEFNGVEMMACRVWFVGPDGQMHPSRNGLNVKVGLLPALIEALTKAQRAVETDNLAHAHERAAHHARERDAA